MEVKSKTVGNVPELQAIVLEAFLARTVAADTSGPQQILIKGILLQNRYKKAPAILLVHFLQLLYPHQQFLDVLNCLQVEAEPHRWV